MTPLIPRRFYSLDLIRGLAALSVVFWHWQHFFYDGSSSGAFDPQAQPFYTQFFMLYQKGWLAVDFFFSLSGFIFFWLYAKSIAERRMGAWDFFVLRFSRLYPLHIATFLFVLCAQSLFFAQYGDYFVYPNNDLYHGVLHVLMASNWGLERGWAFNAPIWSVSVEVLMYALFFSVCLLFRMRLTVVLLLICAGLLMLEVRPVLGRGLFSFFMGGLAFMAYRQACAGGGFHKALLGSVLIVVLLWVATALEMKFEWLWPRLADTLAMWLAPQWQIHIPDFIRRAGLLFVTGLLFPLTIISLALIETWRGCLGRRLAFLGHISYSSYLLHFPLQLVLFSVVMWLGVEREFFYSKSAMLIYFAVLIPLCLASYYFFECPVQRVSRKYLLGGRDAKPLSPAVTRS